MKKIFIGFLALGILATGLLVFTFKYTDSKLYTHKVALVIPAVHPSMEQIEKGFLAQIKHAIASIKVDVFNANGQKTLLQSQLEEIALGSYDAVATLGTNASQMAKHIFEKKELSTPLIFMAVADPVARGIIDPLKDQAVTGVIENYDYNDQINLLKVARPDLKKVVLVYDRLSNPLFDEIVAQLQQRFEQEGITFTTVEVQNAQEIRQKALPFIEPGVVVMTLTDHTVCTGMDALIKICNQQGATLFTSELDSNKRGAALSYGVYEREYGSEAAKKVLQIIDDNTQASAIPVTPLDNFYLMINQTTAKEQGVNIDVDRYREYGSRIVMGK